MAKEKKAFDEKLLKGLVFRTSELNKDKEGKKSYVPVKRPLAVGDILDWKDCGETVVLVTTDGQKYTVEKGKGSAA